MRNIKCPICNGQSIYDSNNEVSFAMRDIVAALYTQHKTKAEIESYFKKNFGNDIILNNSESYIYMLYILPLVLSAYFLYNFISQNSQRKSSKKRSS